MKKAQEIDFRVINLDTLQIKPKVKKNIYAQDEDVRENISLLEKCREYYDSLYDFRNRRKRNREYYRGNQWGDIIVNPDTGESTTEENYIKSQGKVPMKQNIIRQLIKNLLGQYRLNPTKSIVIPRNSDDSALGDILSNTLQAGLDLNMAKELDVRNYEEFLISGASVGKVGFKYWKERNDEDLYIENTNPNRMFFNTDIEDIRLKDISLIGEIIDMDIDEIIGAFATSDKEAEVIRSWYNDISQNPIVSYSALSSDRVDMLDFYIPEENKCRVFEVWELKSKWIVLAHDPATGEYGPVDYTMEEIDEMNQERIRVGKEQGVPEDRIPLIEAKDKYEQQWYVKFLTPYGNCLWEGKSPYEHEEHPYVLTLYPLLDGEVWGLVEDIIDQQRSINRLISLMDFVLGASAKGVLLVPEDAIPDDMDINDIADEWSKFNGVIKIKTKPGTTLPQQIYGKAANIGINELLGLQMKLMQEIAGVSGAIQGHTPKSGTPSSLYAQEAQNSAVNSKDYTDFFSWYKKKRDMKALQVQMQFYKEKRYLAVSGKRYDPSTLVYDPEKVKNVPFEMVVTQTNDTPVHRQMTDDLLFELLKGKFIDIRMFLENSSLPFADNLLQSIDKAQQQIQQGQLPQDFNVPEDAQADPRAMELVNQMLNKQ